MTGPQKSSRSGSRFAGIEIPAGLRWSHFFNLYVAAFLAAFFASMTGVVQPAFLKEVINIPEAQAGAINAGLQNIGEVATLLFVGALGILSDKVGRRIMVALGFLVCGIFFIIFAYAKDISLAMGITSVGGQVFITYVIRFIIGIGFVLSWPQVMTMVADYTYPPDRGKAMSIHGLMMCLGSIIVYGILAQVAKKTGLMSLFYISGAMGFLGVAVGFLWLVDRMPKEKAVRLGFREIYRTVSRSLALKVSYLATFLIRVDIVVITVFIIVWMVYAAEKFGMNTVQATARGSIVIMVMSLVCLVAFPAIGILVDRWGRVQVIITTLLIGGAGFCLLSATRNPFSSVVYVYASLIGVGFSGATMAATTLAADASPKEILGSILGGLNTMQPIGLFFFLMLGGILFDKVGYWTPFALKGVANVACGLWVLAVRKDIVLPQAAGMASTEHAVSSNG